MILRDLPCHLLAAQVMSGPARGTRIQLDKPILLGRDRRSRVAFDDERVSRHHALIDITGLIAVIRDLGSKNGTFVNGHEIKQQHSLRLDDRIRIGRIQLVIVRWDPESEGRIDIAGETWHDDSSNDPGNDDTGEQENLRLSRRMLRRSAELTTRLAFLCRQRIRINVIVDTIRKEFRADAGAIFRLGAPIRPVYVEESLQPIEPLLDVIRGLSLSDSSQPVLLPRRLPNGEDNATPHPLSLLAVPFSTPQMGPMILLLHCDESRPFEDDQLAFAEALSECLGILPLERVLSEAELGPLPDHLGLIGGSEAMTTLREHLRQYAATNATVLITGESGTGKELCARAIHHLSSRRFGPYVEVNAACMMPELLEAELFGAEKGAYSGASERRIGKLEYAAGGTLFLDEIGELPLDMQARLLRVLEGQPFYRLGGTQLVQSDVRFLCATNRNLEHMVEQAVFRADLYHRINILTIKTPTLRSRVDDIPELVPYLMSQLQDEMPDKPNFMLSPRVYRRLLGYVWPGNVRELRNLLQRLMLLSPTHVIEEDLLPPEIGDTTGGSTSKVPRLQVLTEMMEREEIMRAMQEAGGQKSLASRILGISRPTLDKKLKLYAISVPTRSGFAEDTDDPAPITPGGELPN